MNGWAAHAAGPWLAFTIAAFGMIGVPPVAGFISKWYSASAPRGRHAWVLSSLLVLVASTLLNAAYFLPILTCGGQRGAQRGDDQGRPGRLDALSCRSASRPCRGGAQY
jgi:formate hydrogenlyase subunit 3/multisubunit Na+/H+ antiporter MnhD subunit